MFIAAILRQLREENLLLVPQQMVGERKCGLPIRILSSHKKEGYPAIHNDTDGPWGLYAKKDKSCVISLTYGI